MPYVSRARTTLVVPDAHHPFADYLAVSVLATVIAECRPDRLVFLGDWVDNYSISQYTKDPERLVSLGAELEVAGEWLHSFTREVPDYYFCEGNHETRLPRFLAAKAPELASAFPSIRTSWAIPERRWVPYRSHLTLGRVSYAHDLGHAGKGALGATLDAFGDSIVFGHTHRAGILFDGDVRGRGRFALNAGWVGDLDAIDYAHRAKCRGWRTGFGWIRETKREVWPEWVAISGTTACVEGTVITA